MAKMGTGNLTVPQDAPLEIGDFNGIPVAPNTTLVINPFHIQPVTMVGLVSSAGTAIMREGFITGTSFLIGKSGR